MPLPPSPWGQAAKTYEWGVIDALGLQIRPDMTFVRPSKSVGGNLRIDMVGRLRILNRRAWGFVVNISEATSETTGTPSEVRILTCVLYLLPKEENGPSRGRGRMRTLATG